MINLMNEPCSECQGRLERKEIVQNFEREGVTVRLCGFKAWVCDNCGETYFEPGGAQKVSEAVNSLFALVSVENRQKGNITVQVS
jgi:YgiT-type zinc finger domain-containing protein